jgi:hypothetical protein
MDDSDFMLRALISCFIVPIFVFLCFFGYALFFEGGSARLAPFAALTAILMSIVAGAVLAFKASKD